jgi:hypothetical protein
MTPMSRLVLYVAAAIIVGTFVGSWISYFIWGF